MSNAVIIPARYESTRFPGKPLAMISGKPMIEWVVNNACKSRLADRIIVATDSKTIFDFVSSINSKVVEGYLTVPEHKCGTDRVCEVVRRIPDIQYVVNLQGDEPLMPPEYIDKVLERLIDIVSRRTIKDPTFQMVSLAAPITSSEELHNPNVVKVVTDKDGYALYFSRATIPYIRGQNSQLSAPSSQLGELYFKHIGIYAYDRETILKFSQLPESNLERLEQLEQLRALENGIKIKLEVVPKSYQAVDLPQDVKMVEELLASKC